jgi:hypothetical protein
MENQEMNEQERLYVDVSRYLAGELEGDEAERVRLLTETDKRARDALMVLSHVFGAIPDNPPKAPPATATMKIKSAVREAVGTGHPRSYGPVLDLEEVASYLKIDRVLLLEHLDELPVFEFAGQFRVRLEALEEWIRDREQQRTSMMSLDARRIG